MIIDTSKMTESETARLFDYLNCFNIKSAEPEAGQLWLDLEEREVERLISLLDLNAKIVYQ